MVKMLRPEAGDKTQGNARLDRRVVCRKPAWLKVLRNGFVEELARPIAGVLRKRDAKEPAAIPPLLSRCLDALDEGEIGEMLGKDSRGEIRPLRQGPVAAYGLPDAKKVGELAVFECERAIADGLPFVPRGLRVEAFADGSDVGHSPMLGGLALQPVNGGALSRALEGNDTGFVGRDPRAFVVNRGKGKAHTHGGALAQRGFDHGFAAVHGG